MAVDVPHFALPFRWAPNGHAAVNDQDTAEDVAACVEAIVRCPVGFRPELVDFGAYDPTFDVVVDRDQMLGAIFRWEPRASATLTETLDDMDALVRNLEIDVQVV